MGAVTAKRILLVDDALENQRASSLILQHAGYQCLVAGNGIEALEIMRNTPLDLVLMDCQMPMMDGWTATETFRSTETQGRRLPVIAVTAASSLEDKTKCMNAGMDGYLQKPFRSKELLSVVSGFLDNNTPTTESTQEFGIAKAAADNMHTNEAELGPEDFCPEAIEELRVKTKEIDPTLVPDIINSLLTEFSSILRQLYKASEAQDNETIIDVTHKMQSRCGRLGAKNLQYLFSDIEASAKARDLSQLPAQLQEAENLFATVAPRLKEYALT